ncbi:MAG: hypothetical protein ACK58L_00540, partial [Planctomycetota bacterium]
MRRAWNMKAIAFGLSGVCGCAGFSDGSASQVSSALAPLVDGETPHAIKRQLGVIDNEASSIDVDTLQAGQRIRLVTSGSWPRDLQDGGSRDFTEYLGTVESIDQHSIVLQDAAVIITARVQQGIPVIDRIPWVNRVFRSTSIASDVQA